MSDLPEPRRTPHPTRQHRRGLFLLPALLTVGNMFCGYACIVYSMRGNLATAAPFVGIAFVLDGLDGRIARLTGTSSAFGLELDSLADVISFGLAPAVLAFAWGLSEVGRIGWAAGFIYVTAAAMRLARFNLQHGTHDKRYFIGMPTPAAAAVTAATVYFAPYPPASYGHAVAAVAVVLVPAVLMVSTIRFRSFKTINFGWGPSYRRLFLFALLIAFIATEPSVTLLLLAYAYVVWALVEFGLSRWRPHREPPPPAAQS